MTTTPQQVHDAIRTHFKTEFADVNPTLEVVYDNSPDPHEDDEMWLRFTVLTGDRNQIDITGDPGQANKTRRIGMATTQIFERIEEGNKQSLIIANDLELVFDMKTIAPGIKFRAASTSNVGRTRDGKWWQTNVVCSFLCDDV